MPKVYFLADPHFYHRNVIQYCGRPFTTVDEMNQTILRNINTVVMPDDTLYLVGDVVFGHPKRVTLEMTESVIKQINCKNLILVPGGHDKEFACKLPHLFKAICPMIDIVVYGQKITLCHYRMASWEKSSSGAWHLFGHHHGRFPVDDKTLAMDVGVDPNGFKPLSFNDVKAHMKTKTFIKPAYKKRNAVVLTEGSSKANAASSLVGSTVVALPGHFENASRK